MKTLSFNSMNYDLIEPKFITNENEAFLLLHGLPGQFSTNLDLGFMLAAELSLPCFFPYAQGLGRSPGKPSLINHIQKLTEFLDFLKREHGKEKFHLIGHSWGGFMAVNTWKNHPNSFKTVTLMAPLLRMPPNDAVRARIDSLAEVNNKIQGYDVNTEAMIEESRLMGGAFLPMNQVEELKEMGFKARIIHGNQDDVIPVEHSHSFASEFAHKNGSENKYRVEVIAYDDNHYLVDRVELHERLLAENFYS
jgi:pimeloyl-ACP methyl ester carboxylesterase